MLLDKYCLVIRWFTFPGRDKRRSDRAKVLLDLIAGKFLPQTSH